ncbi:UNVERIFIED_CONTAM: hypothetical protein NCL1_54356 [Trichonephila clavipes]
MNKPTSKHIFEVITSLGAFFWRVNLNDDFKKKAKHCYTRVYNARNNGYNTTESFGFYESCIGEICAAQYRAQNGKIILMVTIYISRDQSVEKIIEFIHKNLVAYTEAGPTLLNKLPIILTGDFKVDFSKDK